MADVVGTTDRQTRVAKDASVADVASTENRNVTVTSPQNRPSPFHRALHVGMKLVVHAGFWCATLSRDLRGLFAARQRHGSSLNDANIEPTNLCNANCVFCGYQFQERGWKEMEAGLALQIIAAVKQAGVTQLGLTPIVGEPLVHRKLEAFISAGVSEPHPLKVGVTTNGILLTPSRYSSLVAAGLGTLDISMSYPEEEEYRRVYRSSMLRTLLRNIEGILEIYRPGECEVRLSLRTGRYWKWDDHPILKRARAAGWKVSRNLLFDDWSGTVSRTISAEGLLTRPNRRKILPCAMTYAGPHFLSDGRATACGCRDLDGRSELALSTDELMSDMGAVYETGSVEALRRAFRRGDAPEICASCRHYNPVFEGESLRTRLRQLGADLAAAVGIGSGRRASSRLPHPDSRVGPAS